MFLLASVSARVTFGPTCSRHSFNTQLQQHRLKGHALDDHKRPGRNPTACTGTNLERSDIYAARLRRDAEDDVPRHFPNTGAAGYDGNTRTELGHDCSGPVEVPGQTGLGVSKSVAEGMET